MGFRETNWTPYPLDAAPATAHPMITLKQLIGWAILVGIFSAIFAVGATAFGRHVVLASFLAAAVLTALIVLAVELIFS